MSEREDSRPALPREHPGVQGEPSVVSELARPAAVLVTTDVPSPVILALQAAGLAVTPFLPQDIRGSLSSAPHPCAVIWSDPAPRLSRALESGGDLAQHVREWLAESQVILEHVRHDRRGVLLIDARVLYDGATEQDREAAKTRLGLTSLALPIAADRAGASPLARMIVGAVLPQIQETGVILEELEARSLSMPRAGFGIGDLAALGAEHGRWRADTEEELTLLRTQIELQQQEALAAKAAGDRSIEMLEARHRSATIEADRALSHTLGDLRTTAKAREKAENDLRATAKAREQAENELRETAKARDKAIQERDHYKRDAAALALKLEKILKSKSWRITRPLRGIRSLLRGQRKPLEAGSAKGTKGGQAG